MSKFTEAIELIQNGTDKEFEKGIQMVFLDKDAQKIAKYFAQRYERHLSPRDWEDLLTEAVYRFVVVLRSGKEKLRKPKAYFRSICRNICEEYRREGEKIEIAIEMLAKLLKVPANQVAREKVEATLKQLGGQCELILKLRYFQDEPLENPSELAKLLNTHTYKVQPSSIPTILARCKAKFRRLLGGKPNSLFED